MIVQTLVENAVKHGIARSSAGGVVRLDARVRGRSLEIVVTSTGRLLKAATDEGGFGLQNAAERLRLLYLGAASLSIDEELDGAEERTIATLTLPMERAA